MLLNIFEDFILKSSQNVLNTIVCIESARKKQYVHNTVGDIALIC